MFSVAAFSSLVFAKTICQGGDICITGTKSGESALISVQSNKKGWASVGFGTQMKGACIINGWMNTTNGPVVGQFLASGQTIPDISVDTVIKSIPLAVKSDSKYIIQYSVSIPLTSTCAKISEKTDLIYAFSDTNVDQPNSVASGFTKHDGRGVFQGADLVTSSASGLDRIFSLVLLSLVL